MQTLVWRCYMRLMCMKWRHWCLSVARIAKGTCFVIIIMWKHCWGLVYINRGWLIFLFQYVVVLNPKYCNRCTRTVLLYSKLLTFITYNLTLTDNFGNVGCTKNKKHLVKYYFTSLIVLTIDLLFGVWLALKIFYTVYVWPIACCE